VNITAATDLLVTFFVNFAATTKREVVMNIAELVELIRTTTAEEKGLLPWLKLARFGDVRSDKGSLRHDHNMLVCTGVEADYDDEKVSFDAAVAIARQHGLGCIVYASPSHTPEKPRWRVLAPTTAIDPGHRAALLDRLNGIYGGGIFSNESWTLSQSYYYGSVNRNPAHRVELIEGRSIEELTGEGIGKGPGKGGGTGGARRPPLDEAALLEEIRTGKNFYQPMLRLVGRWARDGVPMLEAKRRIEEAFDAIPEGPRRDRRWHHRRNMLDNMLDNIYGKEAKKRDENEPEPADLPGGGAVVPTEDTSDPDGGGGPGGGGGGGPGEATGDPLGAMIDEMNQRFALVNEAGKAVIYQPSFDWVLRRRILLRLRPGDLRTMFLNRKLNVPTAAGGTVTKTWAEWWLTHPRRRQYLGGVVCDPTNTVPATCWNLYTGLAVTPEPGDWSRMRRHIEEVICSNTAEWVDYLLNTIARMLQQPEKPGEVATVLRGEKGSGKGILLNNLKYAWGQHAMHIANAQHLTGNFNAHLRDCVMLFGDEAFFANDRRHESVLKALITEPTLPIEGKHQNVVEVANLLHVFLASNAEWVVPASIRERRFFVLDVLDTKLGQGGYFKDLAAEMCNGGLPGMLWDLLRRDISGFDPRAVPETTALRDQKLHSLDSLHRWWLAVLGRSFVWKSRHGADLFRQWQTFYTTELLWRSYLQWCSETHPFDRRSRVQLGKFMTGIYQAQRPTDEHAVYELDSIDVDPTLKVGAWLDRYSMVRKADATGYWVDDLEVARARFLDIIDIETEWN
jgi:hypothetical protein